MRHWKRCVPYHALALCDQSAVCCQQLKAADSHFTGSSQVTICDAATSHMVSALHLLMNSCISAHLVSPDKIFTLLQGSCNDEDPQCSNVVAMKFFVKPSELVSSGGSPLQRSTRRGGCNCVLESLVVQTYLRPPAYLDRSLHLGMMQSFELDHRQRWRQHCLIVADEELRHAQLCHGRVADAAQGACSSAACTSASRGLWSTFNGV